MKTVGIAIDSWKLPVFKQRLSLAGYEYTQHPGVTSDTILLKVMTEDVSSLQHVVLAANTEAARSKR